MGRGEIQRAAQQPRSPPCSGVTISTILACLAAYGLARFRFAGRLAIRLLFIGGLVVPVQLIILPLFIMFRQIGILGRSGSLVLVYSVFGIPLGVLVLTGFFAALPRTWRKPPASTAPATSRSSGGSCCR